jgi:beta-N-acetylhexosaminidase
LTSRLFGVGISGFGLTAAERKILDRHPPRGIILFRRNLESPRQAAELAADLRSRGVLVYLDQEGGSVDRLRDLLGPSLSFFEAARSGAARRAGELAGEACARIGVDVDLAPVVDLRIEGASALVLGGRCASGDPAETARAGGEFLAGLHSRGIGGCVKHFPGLGRAELDTHAALPVVRGGRAERERDLLPFRRTARRARAVMISHAARAGGLPASLDRAIAYRLLRRTLRFEGAAFSDDLEMGALAAFGDLPERCVRASRAGCDLLFVSSRIEDYPACVEAVERRVPTQRRAEALARLDRYDRHLARLKTRAAPPRSVTRLIAAIARLREAAEIA